MKIKAINKSIKDENGIIFIEKKSEQSFGETLIFNSNTILSLFFFLKRKKDFLIQTDKRILLIYRNKLKYEIELNDLQSIEYNGKKPSLEVIDKNGKRSIDLTRFRVSYDEGNKIRSALKEWIKSH